MTRFPPEACLALVLAFLIGCDRPVVDPIAPDIDVVSPDLETVQTANETLLQLSVEALSGVDQVRVNGQEAVRSDASGLWELEIELRPGANTFVLEASSNDATATREVDIVQAVLEATLPGTSLPEPRADHTTTVFGTNLLVAGGVGPNGDVLSTARVLREPLPTVLAFDGVVDLQVPRTGHTASEIGFGRVLLLGGTSTPEASGTQSFIATPEVYDPATGATRPVFTRGAITRRSHHSAQVLISRTGRRFIYALGGDTPGGPSDTVDIFEVRSSLEADTLITLTPGGGANGPERLARPTQVFLSSSESQVVTILTGFTGADAQPLPYASRLFYTEPGVTYPFGLNPGAAETPQVSRTEAAGVWLGRSLSLIAGGRGASGAPLASMEIFSDRAGRFLSVPEALRVARYGHTVTLAPSGRILVLGGRDASGRALDSIEVLTL